MMKKILLYIFFILASEAVVQAVPELKFLVCQDSNRMCKAWKLSQLANFGARQILQTNLRDRNLCGYSTELIPTDDIKIKTLIFHDRVLNCEEVNLYNLIEPVKADQHQLYYERVRRDTPYKGRGYRGQTQSQYLSVNGANADDGKAEAHSSVDGSHALVSESHQ